MPVIWDALSLIMTLLKLIVPKAAVFNTLRNKTVDNIIKSKIFASWLAWQQMEL